MGDSPEKAALIDLTVNVIRTLNKLNEAAIAAKPQDPKLSAKLRKIATELETHNDDAMRSGLQYDSHYIVRLKTGRSRTASQTAGRTERNAQRDARIDHPGLQAVREI